jgi:Uma2 family endonuclease
MAVATSSKKLSYEDYLALPDDDGQLYEIIDGELFVNASPVPRHQRIAGNLYVLLWPYVRQHDCGELFFAPLDVVLSTHDVLEPDLLYITKENARILTEKNVQGTPDFVVEILSESNRRKDEVLKLERYDRFGVAEYWIVDPKRDRVKVYRRESDRLEQVEVVSKGGTLTSPFFPGLTIDVRAVFA